ncbi:hypothetical protein [Cryobacterium sp. Y82]|uniref:hypothetical protein n=1 Tax=Cryobacterium sp. Y82 TaxID=2045017 RepID=UPI000CE45C35|nr:hypothetical protein [Cryobacterium sp. Y82]
MESESPQADTASSARAALVAIATDRQRLGRRLQAQTWWTAPAQAIAIAAVIASPAAGIAFGMMMVSAIATLALVGIDHLVRKRMQLVTLPGPTGPMSLTILIIVCVAIIGAFALSIYFEINNLHAEIVVTAVAGFVAALIGSVLYDLANARKLLRVG